MRILYINNDGGGFADYIEVEPGVTVQALFADRVAGRAGDYLIRVNRQPAAAEQVLQVGDRVSFTPVKIEGAGFFASMAAPRQQPSLEQPPSPFKYRNLTELQYGTKWQQAALASRQLDPSGVDA